MRQHQNSKSGTDNPELEPDQTAAHRTLDMREYLNIIWDNFVNTT